MWLQSVAEYLASEALRRVLRQLGVEVPTDFSKPAEAQSPVLDQLAQMIDSHDSGEDIGVVAGLVGLAYLGLVGYAVYWNVTHSSGGGGEHPDGDGHPPSVGHQNPPTDKTGGSLGILRAGDDSNTHATGGITGTQVDVFI